jgi:plastocyanin
MKKVLALLAVVLAAGALVACGDDDDDGGDTAATTAPSNGAAAGGGGGGGEVLRVAAPEDGSLAFEPEQLSAEAGNLTIEFDNPAAVAHNVEVESQDGEELGVTDTITQDTTSLRLDNVTPGTYEYYCNVPGHQEGGMEGTLTVR